MHHNQRENLKKLVIDFCNEKGSKTFSLQELNNRYNDYSIIKIGGKTPQATVRRLLQELRDTGIISFLTTSGHYTLQNVLLETEKNDIENIDLSKETPNKKEYLIEMYARSSRWVQNAKEKYGLFCMMDKCSNTFLTTENKPYIEVHHIIPLHQKGEDSIWNLSVLCAHHHKMAHFAHEEVIKKIQNELLYKVKNYRV